MTSKPAKVSYATSHVHSSSSSPQKGNTGNTSLSQRTSTRDRRPSREALEAIVTNADVHDGMSGGGTSTVPSLSSLSSNTGANPSNSIASSSISSGLTSLSQLSQSDIHNLMSVVAQLRVPAPSSSVSSETKAHRVPGGPSTASVYPSIPIVTSLPPPVRDSVHSRISVVDDVDNDDTNPTSDDDVELTTPASVNVTRDSGNDLVWDMMVIPANERMAANAIALCQRDHGTFRRRAMDKKCSDRRNVREIEVLSLIFDSLIAGRSDVAMELIARRIVGIEEADCSGSWRIADAIQVMRAGSLMSEHHRRHFVKVAKLLDKDKKDGSGSTSGSKSTGSSYRFAKKPSHRPNTKRSSSNTASSTISATGKN
jgi:hypothetical protein